MCDGVLDVRGLGVPAKIAQPVVGGVAVVVASNLAFESGACECRQYQRRDVNRLLRAVVR
jgi:hypothetical protein